MKPLLNTLYITQASTLLRLEGETVHVSQLSEGKRRLLLRQPLLSLDSIVCFGRSYLTPQLMAYCATHGVSIVFLNINGRFLARVQGALSGNILLRRQQYRLADQIEKKRNLAQCFIESKIANSIRVLQRFQRDHQASQQFKETISQAQRALEKLKYGQDIDTLRGIEGHVSALYFGVFNEMITQQKEFFIFSGRQRRPPPDPINCLLSYLYTLMYHDAASALETVGLDPAAGFLHQDRPGRLSLALDLIEEMRAFLADRLVLSLINRRQIKAQHFKTPLEQNVRMTKEGRKILLIAYQQRKQEKLVHPYLKEEIAIGRIVFAQAQLLSRYMRGDLDDYPAFFSS